ncbi:4Fe-4S binding protein [Solidesulfovibrio magneticus]|uniref:Iron-sulfur binding protein n=1 Tax=Solidesulfovibrio magneticus (strain ATCC 700980 / DSM 13731 / RS-1) TaxID=573370 RepID=C4XL84_SOLM1|nr:4Fe-4S dicluster domain-containing protein [Solidesulfovibrio magneticus]BAH77025.1 iron-sulfur binding protein [Solidesulfovibrio magneticus RS-1]
MTALGVALQFLGLLVFAAHSLRGGDLGLCASVLVLAGLLAARRDLARWLVGPALLAAGLIFAEAGRDMVAFRLAAGLPWLRLAGIMAGVVAVCLAGGLFAFTRRGEAFGRRGPGNVAPRAAAFWIAVTLLAVARAKVDFPILLLDRFAPGWGWLEITALGLYAAWLTGLMLAAPRTGPLRSRYWGAFSLVFFGQLALGLAGATVFLMTGALHLPVPALIAAGPAYRGGGYFMPILYLSTVLLVGPGWCSHLCYIGAADDACARLGRPVPRRLPAGRTWWRAATLALTVGGALVLRWLEVPLGVAVTAAAVFGLVGLGIMATFSRKAGVMVHCAMYCPIGLLGNILGKISPWRVRIGQGCDGCGRCSRVCRYLALTPADLDKGRPGLSCTLCGDCLSACPGGRIGLRFPGLSPEAARQAFFALVVALHAVFLGVARI